MPTARQVTPRLAFTLLRLLLLLLAYPSDARNANETNSSALLLARNTSAFRPTAHDDDDATALETHFLMVLIVFAPILCFCYLSCQHLRPAPDTPAPAATADKQ